jgi:hypothetical protein
MLLSCTVPLKAGLCGVADPANPDATHEPGALCQRKEQLGFGPASQGQRARACGKAEEKLDSSTALIIRFDSKRMKV